VINREEKRDTPNASPSPFHLNHHHPRPPPSNTHTYIHTYTHISHTNHHPPTISPQNRPLRLALCDHIPAVCAFVGAWATAQFVLPCIDTALVDVEERVIARVLACLVTLVRLGLLGRHAVLDKTEQAARLLLHPSASIRHEVGREGAGGVGGSVCVCCVV
jgi:hypothetical protein